MTRPIGALTAHLAALARGERVPWKTVAATPGELVAACDEHDVSGLIHQSLIGPQRDSDWPEEIREHLARKARSDAAIELLRRKEIVTVLDTFATCDVHPILFKGTPLAYGVYRFPALRPRSDTDLLVRREQVERVQDALSALGYVATLSSAGELVLCQLQFWKEDGYGICHALDVHWKISSQSVFADLLTYDELMDEAKAVPALGPHARMAGPVHALLLACVHPVMHHQNAEHLIWVHDIHLLASRLSREDFDRFAEIAVARKVGAICAEALGTARARFGTPIADRVTAALAARRDHEPSAAYLDDRRRWHHELISTWRGLPRWQDRVRLIREVLLPSPEYVLRAYGLKNRGLALALAPALYVHRGLHGILKVVAGRK